MRMKEHRAGAPYYAALPYRLATGIFGLVLIGGGLYATFFAGPLDALRLVPGIALVLFGQNMVTSACAARESWLSRIGPLP